MSLTVEQVGGVANLARLELTPAELAVMTGQLSRIVEFIDQLQELDTEGVEPLAHALEVANVFRADSPQPSLPVDEALRNAPRRRGDFYAVPAVRD